jgi:hypothetical protein
MSFLEKKKSDQYSRNKMQNKEYFKKACMLIKISYYAGLPSNVTYIANVSHISFLDTPFTPIICSSWGACLKGLEKLLI